jgi:ElaB/YqjD/DUF883 family membrane-anchored ribosome-binding protein
MGKDASMIKQDIEETRDRLGDTVEALAYKADVGARLKDSVQDRMETVKGTIGDVMDSVSSAAHDASDGIRGSAHDAANAVTEAVGNVSRSETVTRLRNIDAPQQTQRALTIATENPIGLALVALAIGFLTGSLLPATDVERERLRPIREKVVDQARATTSDLVEAGKAVVAETAQSAIDSALSSAQSHGNDVVAAVKARNAQA